MSDRPEWLLKSSAYKKASLLVKESLKNSEAISALIKSAQEKAFNHKNGRLADLFSSISACFRLLKHYVSGEYRDISLQSITLIVASIIYFVMPFDVVPDFIFGFGFADDAALLGWTFRSVANDLKKFIDWEQGIEVVEGDIAEETVIEGEIIEHPKS